ncbi:MAG: hypothetical protein ACJ04O_05350 [Cellvibrionales bacterium]|nr:hypothetical protein [Porticoccaceae bacterium]|tara:strand:+ start:519 stop:980 length:462 start_codon:yes stop_codon:yes gene_type:complete
MHAPKRHQLSALGWLALSSLLGALLGLIDAEQWRFAPAWDEGYAAEVNGSEITRVNYQRALALVSKDRREPMKLADRQLVMQRLIEAELLVQFATQNNLERLNPRLRSAILQSLVTQLDMQNRADGDGGFQVATSSYVAALRESADIVYGVDP